MAYSITYALEGHYATLNHTSTLKLYSDGDLLATYTGINPGVIVDTEGNPLTRDWTETLGISGVQPEQDSPIEVRVTDAGTGVALIAFDYEGETVYFDASGLTFGNEDAESPQSFYGSESAACAATGRRPPTADIPVYGNFEIHATPTADNHAITKRYLEEHSGDFAGETKAIAGDGFTKNFTLSHTLGTRDVHVTVYDADGAKCFVRTVIQSETMILLTFAEAPDAGSTFKILISR